MSIESNTHLFIVKIWADECRSGEDGRVLDGHIAHAYTRERSSVRDLADVLLFIKPYVTTMGIRLGGRARLLLTISEFGRRRRRVVRDKVAGET